MNLLVDIGNRFLKWAHCGDAQWHAGRRVEISDPPSALFARCWHELPAPRRIMVSNVRGPLFRSALTSWCEQNWRRRPEFLDPAAAVGGMKNRYIDPRQLGPDRWAALLGGRKLAQGALGVIDCGTAITVDVLDENDVFLGGAIMPGLRLARESLLRKAHGIKEPGFDLRAVLGRSTAECVSSGVQYGSAGGVDRLVGEIENILGQPLRWFLTGGDGPSLLPLVAVQASYEPELVLIGLNEALKRS